MARDPHPKAPGIDAGVTEPMIRDLVHEFYARVRQDAVLGPIFNSAIDDWDSHLDKLCAFWSSVTLMTGRYKGTPMKVHAELPQIGPEHFRQWLSLFSTTAAEVCPPSAATLFADRAGRIAESLQMGIAIHRGIGPSVRPGDHAVSDRHTRPSSALGYLLPSACRPERPLSG
jgi:hemoglobin